MYTLTDEQNADLKRQLSDPDHHYLINHKGDLMSHRYSPDYPNLYGPIRFTRIAAESMVRQMPWLKMLRCYTTEDQ